VTRRQAYQRLALLGALTWAVGLLATRDFVVGGVMLGAVLATGVLAIELGGRRTRPPDRDEDE
jgi:hypothetical protein